MGVSCHAAAAPTHRASRLLDRALLGGLLLMLLAPSLHRGGVVGAPAPAARVAASVPAVAVVFPQPLLSPPRDESASDQKYPMAAATPTLHHHRHFEIAESAQVDPGFPRSCAVPLRRH